MSIYVIKVERYRGSGRNLEHFVESPLGITVNKLFAAGFVNTHNRYKTLEEIYRQWHVGCFNWKTVNFDWTTNGCKKIFHLYDAYISAHDTIVTVDYMINLK